MVNYDFLSPFFINLEWFFNLKPLFFIGLYQPKNTKNIYIWHSNQKLQKSYQIKWREQSLYQSEVVSLPSSCGAPCAHRDRAKPVYLGLDSMTHGLSSFHMSFEHDRWTSNEISHIFCTLCNSCHVVISHKKNISRVALYHARKFVVCCICVMVSLGYKRLKGILLRGEAGENYT